MNYIAIGENIRTARKKRFLTQENLAEMCNISPVFVSQIENGMRKPSLETVYNISVALNVTVDELLYQGVSTVNDTERFIAVLEGRKACETELAYKMMKTLLSNLDNGKISISNE